MAEVSMEQAQTKKSAGAEPRDIAAYWKRAQAGRPGAYLYASLVGIKDLNPIAITRRISRGLSYQSLVRFQEISLLSLKEIADLVSISERTISRRKERGRLDPEESDRLLRVARVFAKALELFEGDASAARSWLHTPAKALGGERPIDLARTDPGSREVEALVDRIEHGVLT
jgi:putative toxin-antitoxin system antitoxin component (TIGR02293 family)